jgi:hypothetical protein
LLVTSKDGMNALDHARKSCHREIQRYLEEYMQ